jgi:hypothetical protein
MAIMYSAVFWKQEFSGPVQRDRGSETIPEHVHELRKDEGVMYR